LISRVDLHNALKKYAISEEGIGNPVKIHLSSRVMALDLGSTDKKAVVIIEDGTKHEADLVVGADGVYVCH
jgi:salicylate hydroxylase